MTGFIQDRYPLKSLQPSTKRQLERNFAT